MIGIELVPNAGAPAEPTASSCPLEPAVSQAAAPPDCVVRDLRSGLEVRLTETAGRARAAVVGEIDLGCAPLLERVLGETLRGAQDGLDMDLDGVHFLDCSGLNVLLQVREEALASGIPLKVTRTSPAVLRMFELTGSEELFA